MQARVLTRGFYGRDRGHGARPCRPWTGGRLPRASSTPPCAAHLMPEAGLDRTNPSRCPRPGGVPRSRAPWRCRYSRSSTSSWPRRRAASGAAHRSGDACEWMLGRRCAGRCAGASRCGPRAEGGDDTVTPRPSAGRRTTSCSVRCDGDCGDGSTIATEPNAASCQLYVGGQRFLPSRGQRDAHRRLYRHFGDARVLRLYGRVCWDAPCPNGESWRLRRRVRAGCGEPRADR